MTSAYVTHDQLAEMLVEMRGLFAQQATRSDEMEARLTAAIKAVDDKVEARYQALYSLINEYLLTDPSDRTRLDSLDARVSAIERSVPAP